MITHLGDTAVAVPSVLAVALALGISGDRRTSIRCLIMPFMELLGLGIKEWIGRPRPAFVLFPPGPSSESFPSGHALHVALFFGFLIYLSAVYIGPGKVRALTQGLLLLLILVVGASRVYLGLHWPSDVVGGYLFGVLFLSLLIWMAKKRKTGTSSAG
jgi:undecaprenyl-diphosphatase